MPRAKASSHEMHEKQRATNPSDIYAVSTKHKKHEDKKTNNLTGSTEAAL